MNLGFIVLGLVGCVFGLLVVRLLLRMADRRNTAMRNRQNRVIRFPEDNRTRWGHR